MPLFNMSMSFEYFFKLELCVRADTIPCMLSPWSTWSECSVTCGRGVRTRQRMLKSDPAECVEELEQTEKCMLPECRKCLLYKTPFSFHMVDFCCSGKCEIYNHLGLFSSARQSFFFKFIITNT